MTDETVASREREDIEETTAELARLGHATST